VKLLIVKTSSMGDVVHALPMASDIRRLCPNAQIDWLVEPAFAALPAMHRDVSQVHRLAWRKWRRQLFKRETWQAMGELVDTLRSAHYDLVIDAQGLLKSAWWARRSRAPVAGYDRHSIREPLASLLYTQRHEVAYSLHAIERCRLLAAAALRVPMPTLPAPDFGLQQVRRYGHTGLPARYAVLIPNASRPEKHWPEAHWQGLGRHLHSQGLTPVVLWGSPAEEAMATRIAQACQGWVPPFLTVQEATGLLAGAQLVVGLDTGFSHVAAALGKPVVGIYCDHEPGLTGITGSAPGASLGGKGQQPAFGEVLAAVERVAQAAGL
jgi:heptosyltransferase-1